MLKIEQILKEVYKFYKHSSKRKKGLEEIALLRQPPLADFLDNMTEQITEGNEVLEKRPSLRLKCWNATRWLGRSGCLNALCRAYEYILAHLSHFAKAKGEAAEKRLQASELYEKLTSYDIFVYFLLQRAGSNYGKDVQAVTIEGHSDSRCWKSDLELVQQVENQLSRGVTSSHVTTWRWCSGRYNVRVVGERHGWYSSYSFRDLIARCHRS